MSDELLDSETASKRLGVSTLTLYGWLSASDAGEFQIRGQAVTIDYFQSGRRGQGRIRISKNEVNRLLELMRVRPKSHRRRNRPTRKQARQHITSSLGRPDD
ncbi:DNA-binding protein [Roseiconus lacunae]|uniref:DNA-binding protein n=1 Tax=Roseiconus lacunae TaxID=2605694 RepID=UPI001E3B93C1|nr:DNA-binding protein [Roseiconus lacunae]MCD0462482.1 DNA-binding protein [Roseiconus lacunae]